MLEGISTVYPSSSFFIGGSFHRTQAKLILKDLYQTLELQSNSYLRLVSQPLVIGDVLVLGFANLVADGISMGFGDFVSSSTEKDVGVKERAVTEWDFTHHNLTERRDLLTQYQALGMDINDATMVCLFLPSSKNARLKFLC